MTRQSDGDIRILVNKINASWDKTGETKSMAYQTGWNAYFSHLQNPFSLSDGQMWRDWNSGFLAAKHKRCPDEWTLIEFRGFMWDHETREWVKR